VTVRGSWSIQLHQEWASISPRISQRTAHSPLNFIKFGNLTKNSKFRVSECAPINSPNCHEHPPTFTTQLQPFYKKIENASPRMSTQHQQNVQCTCTVPNIREKGFGLRNLLRSCNSEMFYIIEPLWGRRKPLQFWSHRKNKIRLKKCYPAFEDLITLGSPLHCTYWR
jgi:hypothetical protein